MPALPISCRRGYLHSIRLPIAQLEQHRMSIRPPENNAIVQYAGRNYPRYGIQHNIHCVPVDEVGPCQLPSSEASIPVELKLTVTGRGAALR